MLLVKSPIDLICKLCSQKTQNMHIQTTAMELLDSHSEAVSKTVLKAVLHPCPAAVRVLIGKGSGSLNEWT